MYQKKHISFFLRSLGTGGLGKLTVQLANEMEERGHQVDLILAKPGGLFRDTIASGVNVIDLDKKRVWTSAFWLRRYLRQTSPHALISSYSSTNVVATIGWLLSGKTGRLLLVTQNNLSQKVRKLKPRYRYGMPACIRLLYPKADLLAAASTGVAEDLSHYAGVPRERIHVLYNPAVSPRLTEDIGEAVDHPWFKSDDCRVILSVGRLASQKNFALLLRAFAKVYSKQSDLRLVILGEGKLRPELEQLAKQLDITEVVDLPGFESNPYRYMARAKLFVLSSDFEGFGIVVAEALACGCPVVSTDCPSGPGEILGGGKWGRLVPVGDASKLADAISLSLDDDHELYLLRQRGQEFSVGRSANAYLETIFPKLGCVEE